MKRFRLIVPAVALALTIPSASVAKGPPAEWDGLVRVASKQLAYVYLQPGADFRGYSKVMLEPTEVAFHKNWMKDYNRTQRSLSGKVSDRDVEEAVAAGIKASSDIFAKAWQAGGYTLAEIDFKRRIRKGSTEKMIFAALDFYIETARQMLRRD